VARRVIGLDVGTNAVTVAEVTPGTPAKLTAFGQVALARDAVREGEVVDEEAVVDAIRRLRAEVGVRKAPVRVGLATPRLIVRQVEMPVMSREDLAGALRFQAQDLIPIPVEEAVLDFTILDTYTPPGSDEPVMRVLIAAVQQTTVMRLVDAVERGGLPVESVDIVPLALIRALGTMVSDNGPGAEGIVSIGGGVTCVVVHEAGTPRFVRVLGTGGRALTEAIASTLEVPFDTAESVKRQIGTVDDDVVTQARTAIERPLGVLLDEIRSSLDYYRNQPGATRLLRVQLTGGAAQLADLRDRLGALLGVPVVEAQPREQLQVADIGFDESELPRLDPYLPVAVGLALGDSAGMPVMNLLPGRSARRAGRVGGAPRAAVVAGVAGIGLVAVLGGLTIAKKHHASNINTEAAAVESQNDDLNTKIAQLGATSHAQQQIVALQSTVSGLLTQDVAWPRLLNEVARTMPNNVWLTTFQGQVTPVAVTPQVIPTPGTSGSTATTTAGSSGSTPTSTASSGATPSPSGAGGLFGSSSSDISGTVTFGANGLDFTSVADWLKRIEEIAAFDNLWVPQAQKTQIGSTDVVTFQSTADLTDDARSDRAAYYKIGGPK